MALVAGVYFPVAGHEFVGLDDAAYYERNPNLDGRLGLDDVRRAFARPYYANYTPLTSLSIAVDDALYDTPTGTLLTNVLLHAVASALLLWALWRLTAELGPSLFVAAVFAVHPLHVESVAWASQRKDVLMGVGWTAAMLAYAHYREAPGPRRYAALAGCVVAALLAKPVAVTLPFALLLLDYWPLGRFGSGLRAVAASKTALREAVVEKLPLFLLAALASLATLFAQSGAGATENVQLPLAHRLANATLAYAAYLGDAFWPAGLAVQYPYDLEALDGPGVLAAGALLAAATAAALALAASRPWLPVGWLWFLGTLVPMIGLVQVGLQARADRYMYVPLVGLAIAVAWGARHLAGDRRGARAALAGAGVVVVAALAVAAHAQVGFWRDSESLFRRAVAVAPDNAFAHSALGAELRRQGRLDAAERHVEEAVRLWPGAGDARLDLGLVRLDQGRLGPARRELERALERGADPAAVHVGLGLVAERTGDEAAAIASYGEALRADPQRKEALNNLAWLLATTDDPALRDAERAVALAEEVARWSADDPAVLDTLAAGYAAAGRWADAVRVQERAVANAPDDALRRELEKRLSRYRQRVTGPAPSSWRPAPAPIRPAGTRPAGAAGVARNAT